MPADDLLLNPGRLAAVDRALPVAEAARVAMDRLAELAAAVMDAPIGIVNLVSAREQHLVGLVGADEPLATSRLTSVEAGFCPARTLRTGKPTYIEDVTEDPELAAHPALTELGFVAYAGAPLYDADGHLIGTLCVTDTRARRWRRADRRALEALAESVVSELALHRDIDRRQRLLDAFSHAPAAIAVTRGPHHLLEYTNPACRAIFGDLPAGVPSRVALPDVPPEFLALMDEVLTTGDTFSATDASVTLCWPGEAHPRERFFDFSYSAIHRAPGSATAPAPGAAPDRRGLLVVAVEVTDRVHARRDLERHARHQELLVRANAALNRNLDPAAELQELARVVVPDLADLSTVHLLARPVPPGRLPPLPVVTARVAVAAIPGIELPMTSTQLQWNGDGDPITETIRHGQLLRRPIPTPTPPPWSLGTGSASTIRSGLNHLVLAPVVVDGLVVAVASFGMCHDRPLWTDDELGALGEVARYAGIALGHGLSYQRTRDSALVLQRSLLTEPPEIDGLDICVRYRPAGRDEVGGDWYDAFERRPGQLAVVIGDVVGHDITAAAAMGQLRATLRGLAVDRSGGPAAALDRLVTINERLAITEFATLILGHLTRDREQWILRWACAGHPPPLLVAPDGGTQLLDQAAGLALIPGVTRPRTEAVIRLPAGSTLLLYTDGLVERRRTDLADNIAALRARAAAAVALPVAEMCDEILCDAPTDDDLALLVIRLDP